MAKLDYKIHIYIVFISIILISTLIFFLINVDSNVGKYKQADISEEDLSKIQNNIEFLLCSQYQIMKDWKFRSCESIIGDKQLLEYVDTNSRFKSRWYEKTGLIVTSYDSTLKIDAIEKVRANVFLVATTFGVEFYLKGRCTPSMSKGEKHQFEVSNIDGKWYITKMQDDRKGSFKKLKPGYEAKYKELMESKIESIKKLYNDTF